MKPFPAFNDDPKLCGFRMSSNKLEVVGLLTQILTLLGGIFFYFKVRLIVLGSRPALCLDLIRQLDALPGAEL